MKVYVLLLCAATAVLAAPVEKPVKEAVPKIVTTIAPKKAGIKNVDISKPEEQSNDDAQVVSDADKYIVDEKDIDDAADEEEDDNAGTAAEEEEDDNAEDEADEEEDEDANAEDAEEEDNNAGDAEEDGDKSDDDDEKHLDIINIIKEIFVIVIPDKEHYPGETSSEEEGVVHVPLVRNSAFAGDDCAMGYAKINGICADIDY